jgi:hypothetical protein
MYLSTKAPKSHSKSQPRPTKILRSTVSCPSWIKFHRKHNAILSTGTKEIESRSDCLSLSNSLTELSVDTFDYRIVVLSFANSWQQDPVLRSHIMCKNFDEKIAHHTHHSMCCQRSDDSGMFTPLHQYVICTVHFVMGL